MKTTIWLHSHFNLIDLIKQADVAGEFHIVGSYHSRKYPEALLADEFFLEPKFESRNGYLQWCLDFVVAHSVRVLVVGRSLPTFLKAEAQFKALGCSLAVACDAATHSIINDKVNCYDALNADAEPVVPLPDYLAVESADEFMSRMSTIAEAHRIICFKPAVGIFGYGFRIIESEANAHLLKGIPRELIADAQEALAYVTRGEKFQRQLFMEYLPGPETSVDCLAHDGKLLRSVVRNKRDDGSRVLSVDAELTQMAARLVERFRLNSLFNVQFRRRADGSPVLLEINTRMSGGTGMSSLAGLVLPYWGIKLALGQCRPEDVPFPQIPQGGLRVAEVKHAVVL